MSLSERLREIANGRYHTSVSDDLSEAAATIDHQAAEIERLRASLDEAVGVLRQIADRAGDGRRTASLPVIAREARAMIDALLADLD